MVTIAELKFKLKLYGPIHFILFSILEIYRISLRRLNISYSQSHEDLYLSQILNKKKIFYIDIGANDPIKFNNTYKFYKRNGKGINIEPNPELLKKFKQVRPRDCNLNIGIGNKAGKMDFYIMNPDVNSTFNKKQAQNLTKKGCEITAIVAIKIETLGKIFKKYVKRSSVDLISIDTEGYDYQILCSNNWNKYRAKIIVIESNSNETKKFLSENKYQFIKKIGINYIYIDTTTSIYEKK